MAGLDILLRRRPPTAWDNFKSSPLLFLAQRTYAWTAPTTLTPAKETIRVVCISDTHNTHHSQPSIPAGDILIHSGDLTQSGTLNELCDALDWLSLQPHPFKIFIAGNHDSSLADPETRAHVITTYPALTYLENSAIELTVRGRTLRVYGSPYTPKHGSWAFQYPRVSPTSYSPHAHPYTEHESTSIWSSVPPLTDILITHGPPFSLLDLGRTGCYALLCALWRVRPRLHVFGHIHAARGVEHITWGRVQRAYEDVCAGKSGWGGMGKLVWWAVVGKARAWLWGGYSLKEGERTTLVNAAAVGGMKDDQMRGAVVVEI
ncbi:metallophosphoesterase domain-containing protein 1 [Hygrophoropsis aurantiaca]|uniref:Metallophosphoesterase domain-containing protein 1 n=1 Tax=Hygrophoropsis aurantiaca TaxID=72124 RepID=A0ACB7ZU07_9AGAM|nr:metallophosphoesterase domain-containing protein 1 [Hygrophoropsis aurantiaca]